MKLTATLGGSLAFALMGATAGAQDVTIRYTEWLPPTYFMNQQVIYPYFEEIEKVTDGRVVVEVSAGPLGPPPRNYQMVVQGIADMAWGVHGFTPGTFPLSESVELPFHSTHVGEDSAAYWKTFTELLEPANMHPGVVTLALNVQPPGQLFNNVREIAGQGDFEGLKIRTTNTSVSNALTALGANPLGIPVTEMREALEKGIVDGISLTDEALFHFNVHDHVTYELETPGGLYNASMFLVLNPATWARIAEEDQAAIMEISGEKLSRMIGDAWQKEHMDGRVKAKDHGIQLNVAEGDLLAYLEATLAPLEAAWIEKANSAGVDAAAVLEMYRTTSRTE